MIKLLTIILMLSVCYLSIELAQVRMGLDDNTRKISQVYEKMEDCK